MKSLMIEGTTRVCGKAQGYLGLAIRDERINDPVLGPNTPLMVTAWEVFPDEMERLRAGAPVVLSILGQVPPPLLLEVGRAPDEIEAKDQTELHNVIAGRIVASIVRPIIAAGGTPEQVLVLLESVVAGAVFTIVKLGGDEKVLDILTNSVRERLATMRRGDIETKGKA